MSGEPYQQTVGTFADMFRQTSGREPAIPAKAAQAGRALAGRDDIPVS